MSISHPERDWRREVVEKLNELTALPRGWDGYHARAVRFDTANFALQMLEHICPADSPAPQIVPGTKGDLQVEWHSENGEVELDVLGPYRVEGWFADDETGPEGVEFRLKSDFTLAAEWVRKVTEPAFAATAAA
ncbi:hypothetical protein [Croceibacterium aestuarii]|uniref:hypothetical protein n=1 Tax=Croceibacterium aestuarii TaxID=3064139 RepID=UPI00272E2591|nr:hypothetical protein [Croceibacterium sp. D39]